MGGPHLVASPEELDFGAPLLGSEATLAVTLLNSGDGALAISAIAIDEPGEVNEYSAAPAGSKGWLLAPDGSTTVTVTLRSIDNEEDLGTLVVISDDPDEPRKEIPLIGELKGNSALVVCVQEEEGNFEDCAPELWFELELGGSATRRIAVWNGGEENRPLALSDVALAAGTQRPDLYRIDLLGEDGEPIDLPRLLSPPLPDDDPERLFADVTFIAATGGTLYGLLRFESDAEENALVTVPIVARVSGCPPGLADANEDPADGCECFITVESCDGEDDDCDGFVDEGCDDDADGACDMYMDGECFDCNDGNAAFGPDAEEVCDDADNDCDGWPDEGDSPCGGICPLSSMPGDPCDGPDPNLCAEGAFVCAGLNAVVCAEAEGGVPELCNGVDDDCDGAIDEGTNACGGVCALTALPGGACDGPDADMCSDGLFVCGGLNTVACTDAGGAGSTEICNGLDDDCDDEVDEGVNPCGGVCILPGDIGDPCDGSDGDFCEEGTFECATMNALSCDEPPGDEVEICNGVDDDCDGTVDDGFVTGAACDSGDTDFCTEDVIACTSPTTTGCVDAGPAISEACNGADDDCDGVADEGLLTCFISTGGDGPCTWSGTVTLAAGVYNCTTITVTGGALVLMSGAGTLDLRATGDVAILGAINVSGANGSNGNCGAGGGGGYSSNPTMVAASTGAGGSAGLYGSGTSGESGSAAVSCSGDGGSYGGGGGGNQCGAYGGGGGGGGYAGGGGGSSTGSYAGGAGGGPGGGSAGVGNSVGGGGGNGGGWPYNAASGTSGYPGGGGGGGSIGTAAAGDLAATTTFYPGSGAGGGGGCSCGEGGAGGGGGGGALRISSITRINIASTGQLLARGGNGGAGAPGSGGGGGSGGIIYLSTDELSIASGATISATAGSGGGGATGGGVGGLGRIRLSVDNDTPGACVIAASAFNPPLASGCADASSSGYTYIATWPM